MRAPRLFITLRMPEAPNNSKQGRVLHWPGNCSRKGMPEKNQEFLNTEGYAPREYSKRRSAIITLKIMLLGGGVLGALWLLDTLVAP